MGIVSITSTKVRWKSNSFPRQLGSSRWMQFKTIIYNLCVNPIRWASYNHHNIQPTDYGGGLYDAALSVMIQTMGIYSNLFLVPKLDGGWKTVINLKALNEFIQLQHFNKEWINNQGGTLPKDLAESLWKRCLEVNTPNTSQELHGGLDILEIEFRNCSENRFTVCSDTGGSVCFQIPLSSSLINT